MTEHPPSLPIAFQGHPGAYSDLACRREFPGRETLACADFEDVFARVHDGAAELAVHRLADLRPVVAGTAGPQSRQAVEYPAAVGVALLPSFAVGKYLRDGRLVAPLPDWRGFNESTLYAAYLPNRYGSPKLRAFVDFLVETIGDPPYWDTLDLPANAPVAARRR
jgi:DNA-binding transcriptional LysR family regulator